MRRSELMRALRLPPVRWAAAPAYRALVAGQVAWFTRATRPSRGKHPTGLGNVTLIVKTFERPHVVQRLLRSVRVHMPTLNVVVADDSAQPGGFDPQGATVLKLPYQVGVSAGRNAALDHVPTPFVAVVDDDFVFGSHSHISRPLRWLEVHPQVDICAGQPVDLPDLRRPRYDLRGLYPGAPPPRVAWGDVIGGMRVHAVVPNFFLGRTDSVRRVRWDPALKRIDHLDFFSRASGDLVSVLDPGWLAYHAKTPFDARYMAHRTNFAQDQAALARKWPKPSTPRASP